ncbi:hypothetical protein Desor_0326 [Desulfosporosinus orientis DSM 765]|uniref:DUF6385 domain-containing protein n=1 Tax=Desulfosporosinus orientis (strain ATCC 19365 / DSM 765 / NCIMB 8382 / VKM B-1628 / Singapore I) TaxID=768706 RepID=G7W524_DESOD|nr:DUF6385 domain-containing protein [Desulfosporosinus orientis]AET66040.1 hypothetical protein Desor_0326 [Desulfosporosinus orientis DSM 765]
MANFKIFQDNPDQAKVKIFGGNNQALNTDSSGNLTITSTGLAITPPADGLAITSTGLAITAPTNGLTVTASADGLSITPPTGGLAITPPADGLAITSTGLAITAPTNGLTVTASADGLSITPPTGGLAITPPTDGLLITSAGLSIISGTTDVSATLANITDTAGSGDEAYNVLGVATWTFGVVNASLDANAQALVTMQISPDGENWLDEAGPVTIDQNSLTTLVSSIFLKYARIYYSAVNAASAVTLNVFFQGEL